MNIESQLAYANSLGQFLARYSSIPPVAGRLLGFLIVCEPEQQSINELARALKASRSAIVGAVQILENRQVVKRVRLAGNRNDLISFDLGGFETRGFDVTAYAQLGALFKAGLAIQPMSTESQTRLQELADFAEFLSEHMPLLQKKWLRYRNTSTKK